MAENMNPGQGAYESTSTEEAKAKAQGIKEKVVGEVSHRAKSMATDQKDRAAKSLENTARAFRKTGENLKREDREVAAQYVERIAEQVDRFSGYLSEKDTDELVDEIENSIRSRPGIALGTAFLVGFLAARFLKSSDSGTRSVGL